MLPGYINFLGKMRLTYSQGSGAVHEAFYKVQQHKNIMGEEQACGTPVGRNPVL